MRASLSALLALGLFTAPAHAGSGPWVLSAGRDTLYVGVESQRITRLAIDDGSFDDSVLDVDSGISTFGVKAIYSYGVLPRVEGELGLPWYTVFMNRTDGALCTALGAACDPTRGLGILTLRGKFTLLDELFGPPVTLTLGAESRFGQLTARTRDRLTNLGEGTFDAGAFLSVGRVGSLGKDGYWSGYVEGGWRYRFPLTTLEDRSVPGSEWTGALEYTLAPRRFVSFGPIAYALWRPEGVDFTESALGASDWLGSLSVLKLSGGAGLNLRAEKKATFSLSVLHNFYAVNNPADQLTVNLGVTLQDVLEDRK